MAPSYRIFIGAPSIHELANDPKTYSWHTTSSTSASSNTKNADAAVVVPTVARTQSSRGGISASVSFSAKSSMNTSTSMNMMNKSASALRTHRSVQHEQSFVLPKATLEEASRRISLIYRDLVRSDEEEDEELGGPEADGVLDGDDEHGEEGEKEGGSGVLESTSGIFEARLGTQDGSSEAQDEIIPGLDPNATKSVEVSVFRGVEQTTLISWPPSNSRLREDDADETRESNDNTNDSKSFAGPSFLLDNTNDSKSFAGPSFLLDNTTDIPPASSTAANRTSLPTGTQTQTQGLESQSFVAYSDASSIAHFPTFRFNPLTLTPLAVLADAHHHHPAAAPKPVPLAGWHGPGGPPAQRLPGSARNNVKVNLLLAVLEVDGPDTVRLKRGADAGAQVSVLKLILGDEAGNVARLTAWRETAETWAGGEVRGAEVKRGDVVHIESVAATHGTAPPGASGDSGTLLLTASPFLKSKLTICYRTMPTTAHDARLRPDLRLDSDPSVRRVAGMVEWFERMAGLG